jgi:hypothetical protein
MCAGGIGGCRYCSRGAGTGEGVVGSDEARSIAEPIFDVVRKIAEHTTGLHRAGADVRGTGLVGVELEDEIRSRVEVDEDAHVGPEGGNAELDGGSEVGRNCGLGLNAWTNG